MVRDVHHRAIMRPPKRILFLGAAVLGVIVACEQSQSPMIAGIADAPNARTGSQPALQTFPDQAQLIAGSSLQLRTNAPLALLNQVQWQSTDPAVAAVNPYGVVDALTPGTTIVRARYASDTTQVASTIITVVGLAPGS